jgi:hypothetical protein
MIGKLVLNKFSSVRKVAGTVTRLRALAAREVLMRVVFS